MTPGFLRLYSLLNLCTVSLFQVPSYLIEQNLLYKLEQKHIYKTESLVVLQSNELTRVQTVDSTFCKWEHNRLMNQDCLSLHQG